jgi:hypothetical protein
MHRASCWLLLSAIMAGCATYGPFIAIDDEDGTNAELGRMDGQFAVEQLRKMPRRLGVLSAAEQRGEFADEIDSLQCANSSSPDATRLLAMKTPRGSYVRCSGPLSRSYEGTLLQVQGGKLTFFNCYCREAVKRFDGEMEARTTFAPSIEVELAALSHMTVVAVPHKSELPTIPHDTVQEVIFVSGRRRPVDVPPLPKWLTSQAGEAEAAEGRREHGPQTLATIAPGSRVTLRDDAARWYEGSLLGADETTVQMQDCICVESSPSAADIPTRVSYGYSVKVATASVVEVVVLGPPPAEVAKTVEECESCDYCVESFRFRGGSQRPLKWSFKEYTPEQLAELNESASNQFAPIRPFGSVLQ